MKEKKRQLIIDKLELKKKEIEFSKSNKLNILKNEDSTGSKLDDIKNNEIIYEERERRGSVVTCEIDATAASIAQHYFDKSDYKNEV